MLHTSLRNSSQCHKIKVNLSKLALRGGRGKSPKDRLEFRGGYTSAQSDENSPLLCPQSADPWLDSGDVSQSQWILATAVVASVAFRSQVGTASQDGRILLTGAFVVFMATFGYLLLAVPHADIDAQKTS